MEMIARGNQLRRRLDRWTPLAAAVGLTAVALYNWRLWQKDKARLAAVAAPPPRPPLSDWPELPLVSVLVAAWNEAAHIERHIESFLSLRYPHKELILCAGGTDDTYALAQRYAGETVTLLEQRPGEGKQRALARSLPHARGEIVFLTDVDGLLDDDACERTLYLVATGKELVCTGGSRPIPQLLTHSFVLLQAASDHYMYSNSEAPAYLPGLLGRNCALKRSLLEETQALSVPAPTGTDYVLAQVLTEAGVPIRQIRDSQIQTEYPHTIRGYIRQQRRWLRNVAWFGWQFEAWSDVRASLQTSLMGVAMLTLPFFGFCFGMMPVLLWSVILCHGYLSRFRYIYLLAKKLDLPAQNLPYKFQFISLTSLLADFVAWSLTLTDYFSSRRRQIW